MNTLLRVVNFNNIRSKLIALFLVFGIVPAAGIFLVYLSAEPELKGSFRDMVQNLATDLGDKIDRNLFERYGDVQAFGLNAAAQDPANWRRPAPDNPLVRAMDGYMTGYGIYDLMILVDPSGDVLAVNDVDPRGASIDTSALYGRNLSSETWFSKAIAGEFLEGRDGLTGTVVEQPQRNALVGEIYGEQDFVIPFAAPAPKRAPDRRLPPFLSATRGLANRRSAPPGGRDYTSPTRLG